MFEKAPEHDTVCILDNSGAQKGPGARYCWHFREFRSSKTARSTILFSFLPIQVLKKSPEHDTVVIFANSGAQQGPGPRTPGKFWDWQVSWRPCFQYKKSASGGFFRAPVGGTQKGLPEPPRKPPRASQQKRGPGLDTVVVFASAGAQKGPRARYCCHFCQSSC